MIDKIPQRIEDLPDLVPERVAAAFLQKSPVTMWRMRKAGEISWRRIGGVYYHRSDIEEFLERRKRPARER